MQQSITTESGIKVERGDLIRISAYGDRLWRVVGAVGTTATIKPVRWWHRLWWANKRQWRLLLGRE